MTKWWRQSWDGRKSARELLADRYPSLFTNVRCGISIGLSWVPIVCDLADAILATGEEITVEQVKEKFGGLRFYYSPYSEAVEALVSKAEIRCSIMCEFCGKPGTLTSGGWIKTLCREHAEEWERR